MKYHDALNLYQRLLDYLAKKAVQYDCRSLSEGCCLTNEYGHLEIAFTPDKWGYHVFIYSAFCGECVYCGFPDYYEEATRAIDEILFNHFRMVHGIRQSSIEEYLQNGEIR